jgi:hypothetical protein
MPSYAPEMPPYAPPIASYASSIHDSRQYDFPSGPGESSHIREKDPTEGDGSHAAGLCRDFIPLVHRREHRVVVLPT